MWGLRVQRACMVASWGRGGGVLGPSPRPLPDPSLEPTPRNPSTPVHTSSPLYFILGSLYFMSSARPCLWPTQRSASSTKKALSGRCAAHWVWVQFMGVGVGAVYYWVWVQFISL